MPCPTLHGPPLAKARDVFKHGALLSGNYLASLGHFSAAINSLNGNVGLRAIRLERFGHAGLLHPDRIASPAFWQGSPQTQHDRHLTRSQGHQNEHLAVRVLAQYRSVLGRDPNRGLALLGKGCVVNDQPGLVAADQLIRLPPQRHLQRPAVPNSDTNEIMQPVILDDSLGRFQSSSPGKRSLRYCSVVYERGLGEAGIGLHRDAGGVDRVDQASLSDPFILYAMATRRM